MDFKNLPEKQRLCIACGKCCKEVGIYTHPSMYTCTEEEIVDFFRTRGFRVERADDLLVLTLNMPCPHLTRSGCSVYENRPEVCRRYSGLNDFGKGCFWSELQAGQRFDFPER